ncbi:MAG: SOS response-associated peptidase [Nitrospiraceae bacterium]|nr:SOS response-associated peptidase [Nitrospiraceae bacterium]
MCGRFELHSALAIIAQIFRLTRPTVAFTPRYNITPGQEIAIIVREGAENALKLCTWGFLPVWARDRKEGFKMINARGETVAEKPSFREAFARQRCLVVADGFFEWNREGKEKKPVYVHLRSGEPVAFAGLFNPWRSPEGDEICTCAIITTPASESVRPYHDRMPAIIFPAQVDLWLDPAVQDRQALQALLKPCPDGLLDVYEVTPKVNSPKHDSAENIARLMPV